MAGNEQRHRNLDNPGYHEPGHRPATCTACADIMDIARGVSQVRKHMAGVKGVEHDPGTQPETCSTCAGIVDAKRLHTSPFEAGHHEPGTQPATCTACAGIVDAERIAADIHAQRDEPGTTGYAVEIDALRVIVLALEPFDASLRRWLLDSAATYHLRNDHKRDGARNG